MASYIEVDADKCVYETRAADPDDSWDRGNTAAHWTINGLRLVESDGYRVHEVPFDAVAGKRYHLVYAIYSTGDSFGHDDAACLEIIGVFEDEELAHRAAEAARGDGPCINELGEEYEMSRPWQGYFESLDELSVRAFVLERA